MEIAKTKMWKLSKWGEGRRSIDIETCFDIVESKRYHRRNLLHGALFVGRSDRDREIDLRE